MDQEMQHVREASVADLVSSGRDLVDEGKKHDALTILGLALNRDPDHVDALRLRGAVFLELGWIHRALADFDHIILLHPSCTACYFERGMVNLRSGDATAAMADLSTCLSLDPEFAPARASRAALLLQAQRYEEALAEVTRAAAARPDHDGDIHNRAVVLSHLGRYEEAIKEYERALALNPCSGGTHNNLAWLLATSRDPALRDGARAVQHARRAVELGNNDAWMDTLAAAQAECGDFATAVRTETEAYRLSGGKNGAFLERIDIYRWGLSYADWSEARRRHECI